MRVTPNSVRAHRSASPWCVPRPWIAVHPTKSLLFLAIFFPISLSPSVSLATEWYVDDSVAESGDGASWETAFKTIQEGIDAASDADTVLVAEGTYVERIHFGGKNVSLTSTNPSDPSVVDNTVIDGSQRGDVVTFEGTESETCRLAGFTIRNGTHGICGGVFEGLCRARIERNTIAGNLGTGVYNCVGWIRDNTIRENLDGGISSCDGVIETNLIRDNSTGRDGGGLRDCNGSILNNLITGNSSRWGGGLAYCQAAIAGNTISDNWAEEEGGGLYRCDRFVSNNLISRNSSPVGGGLQECDGVIDNNVIRGNSATTYGGGGLSECDGTIQNNTIFRNRSGRYGGALMGCDGTIRSNIICWNTTQRSGGGLSDCNGAILNNTIHLNDARSYGGGFHACAGDIVNCVIWDNSSGSGGQLFLSSPPTYSCIQGWTGGEGNISEDPRFVDPDGPDDDPETYEDNDYRLRPDSPCIDAGFNHPDLPETDILGNPRILYGGRSFTVDMGAYEYVLTRVTLGPRPEEATFTWSSLANRVYSILYSEDLLKWQVADDSVLSEGNMTTSWVDDGSKTGTPLTLVRRRFYRAVMNP